MDPGDHQILVDLLRLRDALSVRQDGYWELLATAAGAPDAVARILVSLSREQLDKAAFGDWVTPSLVRERVEALAAFDTSKLIELADSWRPLAEISRDPFWGAAWSTALRHLEWPEATEEVVTSVLEFAAEAAVIPPDRMPYTTSWDELVNAYESRFTPYETVRKWAKIPLSDSSIGIHQIKSAPLLMLRIFRSRERLLDPSARRYLRSAAADVLRLDALEGALLLEIVRTFDPDAITAARRDLQQFLPQLRDARLIIPLVYVLISPDWIAP